MRMTVDDDVIAVSNGEAFVSKITEIATRQCSNSANGGPLQSNELPVKVTIACGLAKR